MCVYICIYIQIESRVYIGFRVQCFSWMPVQLHDFVKYSSETSSSVLQSSCESSCEILLCWKPLSLSW